MPVTTLAGRPIQVNDEGFLTDPSEWDEALGAELAAAIGITMTDEHWKAIRFLREDFAEQGETATLRRVSTRGDIPVKRLFELFPQKPAKKMAYVAGLPKPRGCV
jgi:TusE/DsrC/DsvC family sulfur relay protein